MNTLPNLKLTHFWIHPPEILHFYGIILKTLDKPINLNLNVLDYWLFIYWLLYIDPCVNILCLVCHLFCRISTLIWIAGIKTQNTFCANELDNATVLLELKHTCYVILLIKSFISDLLFQFIAFISRFWQKPFDCFRGL